MSRPSDVADAAFEETSGDGTGGAIGGDIRGPRLGGVEWVRWAWRQLTSMRTALLLLLALAVAAVPGSIIPQESADPNGVIQWKAANAGWVAVANVLQLFSVYTSVWFSAIYLLLFISLVGCVIPRIAHHLGAVRAAPPRTPARLERLANHVVRQGAGSPDAALDSAQRLLRRRGYRVQRYGSSVSAERGYLRETGNLLFHSALVGVLIAVFAGGGFTYTGQRVLTVGETFANIANNYDSLTGGRFVDTAGLAPYSLTLDSFQVAYTAAGEAVDYTAKVTTQVPGHAAEHHVIKVNDPLDIQGTSVFLLGNGYSPHITIKDASGRTTFSGNVPFRPASPQPDLGVIKDTALRPAGEDLGFVGYFYPTVATEPDGSLTSVYPGPADPVVTFNVYEGDLHPTVAQNVYELDIDGLKPIAAAPVANSHPDHAPLVLTLGKAQTLPDGLGTVEFDGLKRFVSIDIHHDPSQGWVAGFVVAAVLGLIVSLLVPRRRMWVKVRDDGDGALAVEYAGLARGDDPGLERAVRELADEHHRGLGGAVVLKEPVGV